MIKDNTAAKTKKLSVFRSVLKEGLNNCPKHNINISLPKFLSIKILTGYLFLIFGIL